MNKDIYLKTLMQDFDKLLESEKSKIETGNYEGLSWVTLQIIGKVLKDFGHPEIEDSIQSLFKIGFKSSEFMDNTDLVIQKQKELVGLFAALFETKDLDK